MNLDELHNDYVETYSPKWFTIGASKLLIGYVKTECIEYQLLYDGVSLTLQDMGYLMMSCLKDWQGVSALDGSDIPFNREQVSIALLKDGSFLELVASIAFNKDKFVEVQNG